MATALQLAGTGMQAYGDYKAGSVNAYIANQRALIATQQAHSALLQGSANEVQYMQKARQFEGAQGAAIGASGVQRSGSPLRLIEDTAGLAAADIARIRNNAAMEAWGYNTNDVVQRFNAKNARNEGVGQAAGALLMGGARAKGLWSDDVNS